MKYIGIKVVTAEPMNAANAEKKNYRTSGNTGDGYEITYEDGYQSWCPKSVFEKNNFTIKNEELASTAKMMVSPDYKERFEAEYIQLKNRYNGLKKMVAAWDAGTLSFTPTCPRATYNIQLKAMKDYLDILEVRAAIEGINL